MNEKHFGDSYDIVKRFWSDCLSAEAPLYSHARFIRPELRERYAKLTKIPVLTELPEGPFGLLLDPDTGIPFPTNKRESLSRTHLPLGHLLGFEEELNPRYIICFDQSFYRHHKLSRKKQRAAKMKFLRAKGMSSFYYVSHAPFLFTSRSAKALKRILERLMSAGIPTKMIERLC
jgi:hypothetical protein